MRTILLAVFEPHSQMHLHVFTFSPLYYSVKISDVMWGRWLVAKVLVTNTRNRIPTPSTLKSQKQVGSDRWTLGAHCPAILAEWPTENSISTLCLHLPPKKVRVKSN